MTTARQQAKERAARIRLVADNAVRDAAVMERFSKQLAEQAERLRSEMSDPKCKDCGHSSATHQIYCTAHDSDVGFCGCHNEPTIDTLQERIADLEAALKPFADAYERVPEKERSSSAYTFLRRAAAALASKGADGKTVNLAIRGNKVMSTVEGEGREQLAYAVGKLADMPMRWKLEIHTDAALPGVDPLAQKGA